MIVVENATVAPSQTDAMLAKEISTRLTAVLGDQAQYQLQLVNGGAGGESFTIPAAAMQLLVAALSEMAEGHAVTLLPLHTELTTAQAADLLIVSQSYLIDLLETGEIPSHKVGDNYRIQLRDVLSYKQESDAARLKALDELVAQAQQLNMGY